MKNFYYLLTFSLALFFVKQSNGQCNEYEIINFKKIAIVFGEKDYKYAPPLKNTVNDALDISDSLKKMGFEVFTYQNSDLKTMNAAIDDWCAKLLKYDVALFYFSGHGAEVSGENFLFPIDANPKGPSDLYYSTFSANKLLARLDNSKAKFNIMILDACRSNPFTRNWSRDMDKGGLAAMSGRGTFIGYAASPGTTASDGDNRNGTYTEGILKNITTPNSTIDQIFTKVNSYVREKSTGKQIPFKNSSLSADFCFSVTRSKNSNEPRTKISFSQPSTEILLSPDEETIFTIDSATGGLLIKDAKTLNNLSTLLSGEGRPHELTTRSGNLLFIIDSLKHLLLIFDTKAKMVKSKTEFKYAPISVTVALDEKKVYVSHKEPLNAGSISVINPQDGKVIRSINTNSCPGAMTVSPDGKYLYIASYCALNDGPLIIVETKTDKVSRIIPNLTDGRAIGISPDNKKIYSSLQNKVHIVEVGSFKLLQTLNLKSNLFAFEPDKKYVFALGESEIAVIRTSDSEISNRLPFATTPRGIAVSSDGTAFVWLPTEKRIFAFELASQAENKAGIDPESNLKKFQEELSKDELVVKRSAAEKMFIRADSEFQSTIGRLINDLGQLYTSIYSGIGPPDYNNFTFKAKFGIVSKFDKQKLIMPLYEIRITDTDLVLILKEDEQDTKEEIYTMTLANPDWEGFKKFARLYFLIRLDRLK